VQRGLGERDWLPAKIDIHKYTRVYWPWDTRGMSKLFRTRIPTGNEEARRCPRSRGARENREKKFRELLLRSNFRHVVEIDLQVPFLGYALRGDTHDDWLVSLQAILSNRQRSCRCSPPSPMTLFRRRSLAGLASGPSSALSHQRATTPLEAIFFIEEPLLTTAQ